MTDPLRAALEAVVAEAVLDDGGFDGECLDYLVPIPTLDALRAALVADTARPRYPSELCECGHFESHHYWTCGDCGHVPPYVADTARPELDVEALAEAICTSQEHCDGTCPGVEGVDAIHRHEALSIAGEYARLTEDRL